MAEIRDIAPDESPSSDQDHVLIVPGAGGKFVANGSASGRMDATFWTPPPFDTLEAAIASAQAWASQNDVPHIFLRQRT
ncbi:hypothetical protein [Methylorubrum extorquens]